MPLIIIQTKVILSEMPPTTTLTLCQCKSKGCANYVNPHTGERGVYLDNRAKRRHDADENAPRNLCTCISQGCGTHVDEETGKRGVYLEIRKYRQHQGKERSRIDDERKKAIEQLGTESQARALRNFDEGLSRAIAQMNVGRPSVKRENAPALSLQTIKYHNQAKVLITNQLGQMQDHCDDHLRLIRKLDIRRLIRTGQINLAHLEEGLTTSSNAMKFVVNSRQTLTKSRRGPARNTASVRSMREQVEAKLDELMGRANELDSRCDGYLQTQKQRREDIQGSGLGVYDSGELLRSHFEPILGNVNDIIRLVMFMLVVGHTILGFPQRASSWLFSMCKYIAQTIAHRLLGTLTFPPWFSTILEGFPQDIRSVTDKFKLEAKSEIYAVCPSCHANYKPVFVDQIPTYPARCNSRRYGHRCREIITRNKVVRGTTVPVPIKPYIVFDFQDWMANLLSRTGYEEKMDAAWIKTQQMSGNDTTIMNDIFQGSRIRNFNGWDGKHFSQSGPETAGRYLFSLGFDFFNPLRNLVNGKKVSVGVIALVCLNLPIDLRYKAENMFLAGLVPGPKEPDWEHINPYFKPIVDVFLLLWRGVFFQRTSLYEFGRMILCALLILICDLPAGRKAGGFTSILHERYCSFCHCNRTIRPYDDYSYNSWTPRTDAECRQAAKDYSEAVSLKRAEARHADNTGVRGTEFLRLPYYDSVKSVVVDPMHNLFLGLIKEHFQNILGYGKSGPQGTDTFSAVEIDIPLNDPRNPAPDKKEHLAGVKRILTCIRKPQDARQNQAEACAKLAEEILKNNRVQVVSLLFVGKGLGCFPRSMDGSGRDGNTRYTKAQLAEFISKWRLKQKEFAKTDLSRRLGTLISEEAMIEVRKDIQRMVKPTWMVSIPESLSSVGPKMKSDEWRAVGSLYLPISLIRLWSSSEDQDLKKVLHLTMLLFSAICVITSREISRERANIYLQHMIEYRKELRSLFPNYKCHPNHHMAFHVHDFIIEYGPVHGWWTFPFERMIGVLGRISTNYHEGEYETTIGTTWARRSNLTAIFFKASCPPVIAYCRDMFMKLVRPDIRGAASVVDHADDDKTNSKEEALTREILMAFTARFGSQVRIPSHAQYLRRYRLHGVSYTLHHVHEGNSGILCHGSNVPYRIEAILQFSRDEIWFVIRAHRPANVRVDPYAAYPFLRAKMWGVDHETSIHVVPVSAIEGQFAKCVIPWENKNVSVCIAVSRT